jgi:uncharacterized protein (TIGR00369 family)
LGRPDEDDEMLVPTLRDGFGRYLGLRLDAVSGDEVRATWSVSPDHHQGYGIVHGGVYCAITEHMASLAAARWFGERGRVIGVSNTTHFIRSVRGGVVSVSATPLQRGRRQQLWQVFFTDGQDRLVAKGEVRFTCLEEAGTLGRDPMIGLSPGPVRG